MKHYLLSIPFALFAACSPEAEERHCQSKCTDW